jgi:hypothetical protein
MKVQLHQPPGPAGCSSFGPLSGSSAPHASHNGYPSHLDKGKAKPVPSKPLTTNISIVIFLYLVGYLFLSLCHTLMHSKQVLSPALLQDEHPHPDDLCIDNTCALPFCLTFKDFGLLLTVPVNTSPTVHVWSQINDEVTMQCTIFSLSFPEDPAARLLPGSVSDEAMQYHKLPWQFCELGSKPRVGIVGRILKVKPLMYYSTMAQMISKLSSFPRPFDNTTGPIIIISKPHHCTHPASHLTYIQAPSTVT